MFANYARLLFRRGNYFYLLRGRLATMLSGSNEGEI
jgi:hypothetical protein